MNLSLRDVAEGFLLLALTKAFIEPLATQWGRRRLDAIAPLFFRVLDEETRALLRDGGTSAQLHDRSRRRLSQLTGQDWSDASLQPLWKEADPGLFLDRFHSPATDIPSAFD